jgi:hypothetical protein
MGRPDDQVVPIADSALLTVKLVKNATLKVYPGVARHTVDPQGPDQRRPPRLLQVLILETDAACRPCCASHV